MMMLRNQYWKVATRIRMFRQRQFPAWRRFAAVLGDSSRNSPPKAEAVEKKLLLLAWEFPPAVTGGVYRPMSFAKYAAEASWKVTVLAGPGPEISTAAGNYLEKSIPAAVAIHRIPAGDRGPHPWPLPNIDGGILNAIAVYEAASRLIDSGAGGVIVASGPPFHNFVAGMWLAKRFGWRLVLDYRDEWTECPFDFVLKDQTNRAWEKRCLRHADHVVFTTRSQLNHETSVFPELRADKCVVIPNGWEPDDFMAAKEVGGHLTEESNTGERPITVAYLGNLGPMAAPEGFLATLARVLDNSPELRSRVQVKFIGYKRQSALDRLREFPYPDALELIDQVPKSEACHMMQSVDALLILNPPGIARYIQGKLYEYIASRTPILVYGEGGEMAEIVNKLGTGTVVPANDAARLESALSSIRSHSRMNNDAIDSWLQSRQRKMLAHQMLDTLDQLRPPAHLYS